MQVTHPAFKGEKNAPVLLIGALLGCLALGVLMWFWNDRAVLKLAVTPLLLLGFHYYAGVNQNWKRLIYLFTFIVAVVYLAGMLAVILNNLVIKPEWDYKLYWVFGQVSSHGLNPYEQANLLRFLEPLSPSADLLREFYFFYEPPTLFLLAPLGWFDFDTGFRVWYILLTVNLLVDVWLLWRIFLPSSGHFGLVFTAAFTFITYPTWANLLFAQLNYFLMLTLLLFWLAYARASSGVWLALSIITKPIMLIGFFFLLLRRRWKLIAASVLALLVLELAAALVYGPALFTKYLGSNPISESMPNSLYNEPINQSLLATILRLTKVNVEAVSPLANPVFWVAAVILTIFSAYLIIRLDEARWEWGLSLTLALGLLIFPKTLSHYALLLLPCMFLLWRERSLFAGRPWTVILLLTVLQFVIHYEAGVKTFFAFVLIFVVLSGSSLWMILKEQGTKSALHPPGAAAQKPSSL